MQPPPGLAQTARSGAKTHGFSRAAYYVPDPVRRLTHGKTKTAGRCDRRAHRPPRPMHNVNLRVRQPLKSRGSTSHNRKVVGPRRRIHGRHWPVRRSRGSLSRITSRWFSTSSRASIQAGRRARSFNEGKRTGSSVSSGANAASCFGWPVARYDAYISTVESKTKRMNRFPAIASLVCPRRKPPANAPSSRARSYSLGHVTATTYRNSRRTSRAGPSSTSSASQLRELFVECPRRWPR